MCFYVVDDAKWSKNKKEISASKEYITVLWLNLIFHFSSHQLEKKKNLGGKGYHGSLQGHSVSLAQFQQSSVHNELLSKGSFHCTDLNSWQENKAKRLIEPVKGFFFKIRKKESYLTMHQHSVLNITAYITLTIFFFFFTIQISIWLANWQIVICHVTVRQLHWW